MFVVPAETINLDACSNVISRKIKSFFGTSNRKPLVGLGVVGTKTFIKSSLIFSFIKPSFSLVANPTAHTPLRGYSNNTTLYGVYKLDGSALYWGYDDDDYPANLTFNSSTVWNKQ